MLTEALPFSCPWCNSSNVVECEPGDAGHWLIQDCAVCCSPIEIKLPVSAHDGLDVRREGE